MKVLVILGLLSLSGHAASSLKQSLKMVQPLAESQLREVMNQQTNTKIDGLTQDEVSVLKKHADLVDKMVEANGFVYLEEPFSVSPYYDFLDAFLLGLKLDTYFSYSTDCINALVYTVDDYAYF